MKGRAAVGRRRRKPYAASCGPFGASLPEAFPEGEVDRLPEDCAKFSGARETSGTSKDGSGGLGSDWRSMSSSRRADRFRMEPIGGPPASAVSVDATGVEARPGASAKNRVRVKEAA